jgi:tetratricopeptide (TPR) repeat protein
VAVRDREASAGGAVLARAVALAGALAGAIAVTAPARAQSQRYPAPPVDAEAEAEARSDFWDEVVRPGVRRYDELLADATEILRIPRGDAAPAHHLLRDAAALRPERVDAWGYLGIATERTYEWAACADAYGKAYARDPRWRPRLLAPRNHPSPSSRALAAQPLELGWATCAARSGDLARAAGALEALVARGEATGEAWLRLGEVYMAEGRLGEAIGAFEQARPDRPGPSLARWLLAIAYDRARRPGDAELAAAEAGSVELAARGPVPLVPPADASYVRAFAARQAPERAIVWFRTYLEQAPATAPWRARAQEHLDALADVDLAARIELEGAGDKVAVIKAVRPLMSRLRACMTEVPSVLVELRITQLGAAPRRRAPPSPRATPGRGVVLATPPAAHTPGVHATAVLFELGHHEAARDAAETCVERVGQGLALPRPPAGSFTTVRIPVVAEQ